MRKLFAIGLLVMVAAVAVALFSARRGTVVHAQSTPPGCDASSLGANFGYTANGEVYDAQGNLYFLSAVGRAVGDGNGGLTGTETLSYDGSIVKRQFTGTYTMNTDCTGNVTLQYTDGANKSTTHADLVAVSNAKKINMTATDADTVMAYVWERISQ